MSFIFRPWYIEHAEREFDGHPDVLASRIAAELVLELSRSVPEHLLSHLRADLNVQVSADTEPLYQHAPEFTPLEVNISGQVNTPAPLDLKNLAHEAAATVLANTGYFRHGDFSPSALTVNTHGITGQSHLLNGTSRADQFADMCRVEGYFLKGHPQGIFPSLGVANAVNDSITALFNEGPLPDIRPDGKVHALVEYGASGTLPRILELVVNSAHARPAQACVSSSAYQTTLARLLRTRLDAAGYAVADTSIAINPGGPFDVYFSQADSGVSKAKDDVLITGGLHQLGTDRVWGKCHAKASSVLIPYTFALARAVCEATGAAYASVSAASRYGDSVWRQNGKSLLLRVMELDPAYAGEVAALHAAFERLPHTPAGIREVLGMPVDRLTYRQFNGVGKFHADDRPWKRQNHDLVRTLQ